MPGIKARPKRRHTTKNQETRTSNAPCVGTTRPNGALRRAISLHDGDDRAGLPHIDSSHDYGEFRAALLPYTVNKGWLRLNPGCGKADNIRSAQLQPPHHCCLAAQRELVDRVCTAIAETVPLLKDHIRHTPGFESIGSRMLWEWSEGV